MDEKDIIAKNITFYRKKMGLSQLELAEKLQYSNKNISKWEKGEATPSIFTLKRLAEVFGITVDQLITSQETVVKTDEKKTNRPMFGKLLWLLLVNAILLACVCLTIYLFSVLQITGFNKWLLLLYTLPLSALSVFIFIACVKKRVDITSISISGWLTSVCIFLTFPNVKGIGYIFVLMIGLQVLIPIIMLIINHHIKSKSKHKKN